MADNKINRNRNRALKPNEANEDDFDTTEAIGTAGGAVAGAAAGSIFGPLGTVAGAIAGGMIGNKAGDAIDGEDAEEDPAK
ncbi:hypothetical protein BEP19_03445 [Ammoniphilus oxalaticus]|uniref:Glycine zipper domain-containing protein n=1 Tax=Ammoniphilus oxalaticus TaxID=66863 RepID=A0A419SP20_9BACL|nr:hypothetical protein [Ammoniphilus oxalaticus]RKD25993.1 hypothetical protein BEP19_03445 [Ammoniphilus oxalaticus]